MDKRIFIVSGISCALFAACGNEEPPPPPAEETVGDSLRESADEMGDAMRRAADETGDVVRDAAEELDESADELSAEAKEFKARAVAETEDRMTQFEARLAQLREKAAVAGEGVQAEVRPLLDQADRQLAVIGEKIDELKAAGAASWEEISRDLAAAVQSLEQSISEAASRLDG